MPAAKIHKDQAVHSYSFFNSIHDNKYRDWKITVAFYTVLQLIDSELTKKSPRWRDGNSGNMYAWRDKILSMYFRGIYVHYNVLLQRSKEARYLEGIGDKIAIDFLSTVMVNDCIEKHFKPILKFFSFFS